MRPASRAVPSSACNRLELADLFPKLTDGGGYELLRTQPNNSRELCVIPPQSGGYTVEYVKNVVSQAKLFVRPIQKDLSLSSVRSEFSDVVS